MTALLHQIDPLARIIVTLLFNSVWQGALVVAAVWLITRSIERTNATTRYLAWCLTLAAIIIVPIATTLPAPVRHAPAVLQTLERIAPPEPGAGVAAKNPVSKPLSAAPNAPATGAMPQHSFAPWWPPAPTRVTISVPAIAAVIVFFAWLGVALVLAIRLALAIARLERLKRDAMPLPVEYRDRMEAWSQTTRGKRRVRLCVSRDVDVPVAVGLFDSMILIPTTLLEQLSEKEIDQISLHELAHLRRWDDWSNGAQRLIGALLFFNPAMAWISRQLNLEREVACDDWVLAQTGNARPYASCLTKLAEVTAWPNAAIAAPGAFITRKNISIRIERLLDQQRNARPGLSFVASAATVVAVVGALVFSSYVTPVVAYQEFAPLPITEAAKVATSATALPIVKAPASDVGPQSQHVTKAPPRDEAPQTQRVVQAPPQPVAAPKPRAQEQTKVRQHIELISAEPPTPPDAPVVSAGATAKAATRAAVAAARAGGAAAGGAAAAASAVTAALPRVTRSIDLVDVDKIVHEVVPQALHEAAAAVRDADPGDAKPTSGPRAFRCSGCNLENVNWAGRDLRNVDLTGANFASGNLSGADLRGARLSGANLDRVNLEGADLRHANFTGANLSNVSLRGAKLEGALFSGANVDIRHLDPQQTRVVLTSCMGCDFAGANLRGMDLTGVRLSGMNLEGADLRNANLTGAKLVGVNLSGAKLDGAILHGASLSGANLDGVDLRHVDLSDVDLTGCNIANAILR